MNIDELLTEKVAKAIEPLAEQIRLLREALNSPPQTDEADETGGIELAVRVTGKARPTIYKLAASRLIPHSKRGNHLYFSKSDLLKWIDGGKRKTAEEIISK